MAAWPRPSPRRRCPRPARGGNLLDDDVALIEGLRREGAAAFEDDCRAFGALADTPGVIRDGFEANDHPPELVRYDPDGERADTLEFHPAWHRLMGLSVEHGVAGAPWADPRPGAHVARAAKFLMIAQAEAGITCPLAMTYSCVPALRLAETTAGWEPLVTSGIYDPAPVPTGAKRGALIGMALTERSGGSDVQTSTTMAEPDGSDGWRVTGAKWFVSAAQSDAFFVLAQTSGGLSLLLVPRLTPDGSLNGLRFDRLKPKLGNRSNPTAEIELERRPRRARRRGGARRARDHGHDRRHAPRLRARLDRGHAPRNGRGGPLGRQPRGLRAQARGPARDAGRARRPGARVGGRDGRRAAPRARHARRRTAATATRRSSRGWPRRS